MLPGGGWVGGWGRKFTTILSSEHKRKAAGGRFVTLLHTHQFVCSRKFENTHTHKYIFDIFCHKRKAAGGTFLTPPHTHQFVYSCKFENTHKHKNIYSTNEKAYQVICDSSTYKLPQKNPTNSQAAC